MNDVDVPQHTLESLKAYIETGRPSGGFLHAVLVNDLRGACARADRLNRHALYDIVYWLTNNAPSGCWGSESRVDEWLSSRRGTP